MDGLKSWPPLVEWTSGRGKGEEKRLGREGGRLCSQFPLNEQIARAHNDGGPAAPVLDHEDVVPAVLLHPVVPLVEGLLGDLADRGQDPQALEEAGIEVGLPQGARRVALGQRRRDGWRDEVGREEPLLLLLLVHRSVGGGVRSQVGNHIHCS